MKQPVKNPARQQGAILIMTAAFIVAAVSLLALAVDTGRLYAAQSNLQKVANIAALGAARVVSGCRTDGIGSRDPDAIKGAASNAVLAAIMENDGDDSSITLQGDSPALGNTVTQSNLHHFTVDFTDVDPREADTVRVSLTRPAPNPLMSFFKAGEPLTATAAAVQRPVGSLQIGSRLLDLDTNKSKLLNALLGGLLGTSVHLTVADYEKLIGASVNLLDLVNTDVDVANVDDLLSTRISIEKLLGTLGKAAGVPNLGSGAIGAVRLGDIVHLSAGDGSVAGQVPLNVLGLVSALAQTSASDRDAVIKLGSGLLNPLFAVINLLPGVDIGLDLDLGIIEPPNVAAIGRPGFDRPDVGRNTTATGSTNPLPEHDDLGARTWVSSSSIRLNADAHATLDAKLLGLELLYLSVDLPVYAQIAPSYALLDRVDCASLDNGLKTKVTVDTQPGILRAGVGHFDNVYDPNPRINQTGKLLSLRVLSGNVLGLNLPKNGLKARASSGEQTLAFDGPFTPQIAEPSENNTQAITSDVGASLGNLLAELVDGVTDYVFDESPFDGAIGGIVDLVTNVLKALGIPDLLHVVSHLLNDLLSVLDIVLNPVLQLLGLGVGQADVTVLSVITNQPQLICSSAADCQVLTQ